jgi:nucleotide-binding universal stress UspA family protein
MKNVIEPVTAPECSAGQKLNAPRFGFSHILAATDFSPNSDKVIDYAIQLAKRLGAKLTLLHIVPEPYVLDYPIEGISSEEIKGWRQAAEKRLAERFARAKLAYEEVESVKRIALHPRDEIVQAASDLSADLLVISTHGYTGWKHLLFGSDAEIIIEHAVCPVLVVR